MILASLCSLNPTGISANSTRLLTLFSRVKSVWNRGSQRIIRIHSITDSLSGYKGEGSEERESLVAKLSNNMGVPEALVLLWDMSLCEECWQIRDGVRREAWRVLTRECGNEQI